MGPCFTPMLPFKVKPKSKAELLRNLIKSLMCTLGVVPEFLDEVPEEPLYMTVEGKMIYPGTPVKTSQV